MRSSRSVRDRLKASLSKPPGVFVVCLIFTLLGIWMVLDAEPSGRLRSRGAVVVWGWLAIVFFGGFGLALFVAWLVQGRPAEVRPIRRGGRTKP